MSEEKKKDLPAMPFYVGDWLKCPEVRALPPDYRGLWFDLLCYMWESSERGVMVNPKGKPYTDAEIIRMVGLDNQNSGIWLTSILENGVAHRRENDGAIYSKKMVRDEAIRKIRRESGVKGGNPSLLDNQKVNQTDKQKVKQKGENEKNCIDIKKKKYSSELLELNEACKKYFDEKYVNEKSLECFDKLTRIDGYSIRQIKQSILNARSEDFWDKNFQSPVKLRQKDGSGVLYIDIFLKIKSKDIKIIPTTSNNLPLKMLG